MSDQSKPKDDSPRISQISHGANSPNIIGDHNRVTSFSVNTARRLTEPQKSVLTGKMSQYSGTDGTHLLMCIWGDAESTQFTLDFVDALRRAGWNLPGTGFSQGMFPKPVYGLVIQIRSHEDRPAAASDLISCLSRFGISGMIEDNPEIPQGTFKLIIGFKPST